MNRRDYLQSAFLYAKRGSQLPHARLTEDIVRSIRERYSPFSVTLKDLAREYGVHWRTIEKVVRYETWKQVR